MAANSPLGIWPSYQVLLCQLIEYSPVEIEIHANRYLLTQARLEGLPIDVISDPGIRLFKTMDLYKKTLIVNDYMHALYEKLTPFELTYFFSTQFHQTFLNIIETSSSFIQQKERILNQLNLLGSDKGFQLEEIFSFNDGTLRSAEALLITVSERLLQRSWLVVEASRKIKNDGNEYRMFSGCILLSWISIEQQRIRLVSFLGQKNALLALEIFLKNNFAKPKLDYFISYLTDLNQLLAVMHPTNKQVIWQWVDQTRIIDFVKKLKDARPLVSLLGHLPEAMQLDFIKAVGDKTIRSLVQESLMTAFKSVEKYTLIAKDLTSLTGLVNIHEISGMTSDFFRTLLAKQFYFFKKIEFPKIYPVIYLHHLDFSGADLREATFSASILDCQFDEARLDNVAFFNKLEKVSFLHTDLRKVLFYSPSFSEVDVRGAVFSSSSFQAVKEKNWIKFFRIVT
ncbi:signal transduction histidine kinase LytS [Candidatus Rickettsiella viridis]|uniref:Signal transduction histidine kinase LytS n=1 Tax=Candidatus Rickettsiella viridis TaxID=676208 RepID=A0A2Z5UXF5_9COXI|nr:pentapeptide repeat-containing protein [Candidatus Rickettsiella viridis]BBB15763.1 signal transduction histidine kinase LytS [Candidatus Rickettsiella viridis]